MTDQLLPSDAGATMYKVVLIFHLKPGEADEELRRSLEVGSFPNRLARQPGFIALELVKIDEDRTMSVQSWASAQDWWSALAAAQHDTAEYAAAEERPDILVSRDFHAGPVMRHVPAAEPA